MPFDGRKRNQRTVNVMAKQLPKRKKRADSFLGIHFDFHAGPDCNKVGDKVTRKMIEDIVLQVRPDYIQCDCKGHRGISSYPTKVAYPAPGFVRDQLRLWREVTAKHGVALFMHYSGVWDTEAVKHHPSWAAVDADGKRNKKNTSVFGPYVDRLLIPQMKELSDVYGVDGVWVDGECWATCQDYGKEVLAAFRQKTGIRTKPKKMGDKGFRQFTEFCRDGFRKYLQHYVTEMHKHNPDFEVASNWAYSSFMPEPVTTDVDFISGDYPLQNSVNAARLEARCIAPQGMPWDLMAWAFSGRWGQPCRSTKTIPQLQQEAAVVLALGGGFQAYFKQKRDGSIFPWQMKLMAETAKFCRAREAICHKAAPVPQVALLLCSKAFYRNNERVFSPWGGLLEPMKGVLNALLDGQNSVEILNEYHLTGNLDKYPIVVIPEWDYLPPKFKKELLAYVSNGGKLLCLGPQSAKLFKQELGVRFVGKPDDKTHWLEHNDWLGGIKGALQRVKRSRRAKAFGNVYAENDNVGPSETAASIAKLGKGKIAAVYFDCGITYNTCRTTVLRDFLNDLVKELFPKPTVEVEGSHLVDVSVMTKDGKLCVNLVNTAGTHANADYQTYDEIPPVGPLAITIRTKKPKAIRRRPGNRKLKFTYAKGEAKLTIPRLEIHDIIVVE